MSLQDLLAQHSRDITANLEHTAEMSQDNVDRKANDIEEKFQHYKDSIEGLGGEIAAGSAAYHMGRAIYNKYQEKYGKKPSPAQRKVPPEERKGFGNQPGDEAQEPQASSDGAAQSSEGRAAANDGATGGSGAEGGGERPTPTDAEAEPIAAADDTVVKPDAPLAPEDQQLVDSMKTELGADHPIPNSYEGIAQAKANRLRDAQDQQAQQKSLQPEQTEDAPRGASEGADADTDAFTRPTLAEQPSMVGEDPVRTAQGEQFKSRVAELGDDNVADADGVGESIGKEALGGLTDVGVEGGLETASAVLDALGPIGEGIGVITSLVGLFEGLAHKKKEVDDTDTQEAGGVSAGLDTSALQQTQNVGVVA